MVPDDPSPGRVGGRTVELMRTDGADRDPRATPAAGSGTEGPTRSSRGRLPPARRRHVDGRLARAQETRRLLVEALLALVDEGATAPTTRQVAERAGVSLRIVFHRFRGTQGLLVAGVALQSERHRDILFAIPPKGAADLRIRVLCRQRRLYFEALTPVFRVAQARPDAAGALRNLLAEDRSRMRHQLAGTFAPEVAPRGAETGDLLDALEQALGWASWRALRDVRGLTPAAAERAMAFTAERLLG